MDIPMNTNKGNLIKMEPRGPEFSASTTELIGRVMNYRTQHYNRKKKIYIYIYIHIYIYVLKGKHRHCIP